MRNGQDRSLRGIFCFACFLTQPQITKTAGHLPRRIASEIDEQCAAAALAKILELILIALGLAGYGLFRGQVEMTLAGLAVLLENIVQQLVLIILQVIADRVVPLEECFGIDKLCHLDFPPYGVKLPLEGKLAWRSHD